MKNLQKIFRVLGNRRRLAMVELLLKRREASLSTVASTIELSLTAACRHLNALANMDILDKRQEGLIVYYRIAENPPKHVKDIIGVISARS
jgi:DNA-binding transcriptional ArsR family regulator